MNSSKYLISITNNNIIEPTISCDSIEEGLLSYKPSSIKGRIVFVIKGNNKEINKSIFVPKARKIFSNPLSLKIFARNLERALN